MTPDVSFAAGAHAFCTYFDRNYASRGFALIESMRRWCPGASLWVLCLDDETYRRVVQLGRPDVHAVGIDELEAWCPELSAARANRSLIEFYFTCTPSVALWALEHERTATTVTYLDADTWFLADPSSVFAEIGDRSIALVAHEYPARLEGMNAYGTYNVGWVTFRRDATGMACLRRWQTQCNDWCYDRIDGARYADQGYLEEWPSVYPDVAVLRHRGVNVAPWNLTHRRLRREGADLRIDGDPLVLFHFHGFKQRNAWLYDTHTARYGGGTTRLARDAVFRPYVRALRVAAAGAPLPVGVRHPVTVRSVRQRVRRLHRIGHVAKRVVLGQYLVCLPARRSTSSTTVVAAASASTALLGAVG